MISDRTIEESTAKYWCAFADKKFKLAIDKVLAEIKDKDTQKEASNAMKAASKDKLDESFIDSLSKLTPADPAGGSVGIVGDLAGKSKEEIKANAAAMASAAAASTAVLTPAGKAIGTAALKHPKASLAVAGTVLAANAIGDKDDSWWQKLEKLVNKVWNIGKFTAQHGKAIAVASTTAYALFKTASIWMPLVSSFVKSLLRGNSLATVEFESNGTWYRMRYDIKSRRWELMYKGFSMRNSPDPVETNQLINTKFFHAFVEQCKKYIDPIAQNSQRNAVLEAISTLTDKDTKQALESVFSDPIVLHSMFAMKFKY